MQQNSSGLEMLLGGAGVLILLAIVVALFIFFSFCLKRICEKAGRDPGVLIWIPFVQLVPLLEVAGMATWMIVLFLIPIVNLVVGIIMWVKVCEARGKSPALVIMIFIPLVNLAFLPYLAFSE